MIRSNVSRLNSLKIFESFCFLNPCRLFSNQDEKTSKMQFNEQQTTYYTAKDVEFCPNRAKEVMQNYVQETSEVCNGVSDGRTQETNSASENEKAHIDIYQSGTSVSLYSVMQSNVPEPFTTKDKAPTHLNMPGSSSSQNYKYLSGKMQSTHHSEQ